MTAMTTKLIVFPMIFLLLGIVSSSCGQNPEPGIGDTVAKIFLSKHFNSSESERILNSAREVFLLLKDIQREPGANGKLDFVKNYANFLLKLFNELQTKDVDVYEIFSKANSFLKGYDPSSVGTEFNVTELRTKVEGLLFAAERHLMGHCNASNERYTAREVLALNKTSFDAFLREKFRTDYTEIGYFLLEVFATVIGLSWGVISAVLYVTESAVGGTSDVRKFESSQFVQGGWHYGTSAVKQMGEGTLSGDTKTRALGRRNLKPAKNPRARTQQYLSAY